MEPYSIEAAERDLRGVLNQAPKGAVRGEWTATVMQAGVSSRSGGYCDRDGGLLPSSDAELDILDAVVERLSADPAAAFNVVTVRWTAGRGLWPRGAVAVETRFDPALVPRGPQDPLYAAAAGARRRFWSALGAVAPDFAAERGTPNVHGQTAWFQPHRRILRIETAQGMLLATDGLSTPWAGVTAAENGVECELFMRLGDAGNPVAGDEASATHWANVLIGVGDLVADGYRILRDVEANRAILFCRLAEDCRPMTRMALALDDRSIEGLPFGAARLIEATPLRDDELAGLDENEPWGASAARRALANRRAPA